ncbi:MAG TPA: hypothetical protein VFA15_03820 [Nitrososphaera sp.]|nr:hypothetical protein [Nitrososphaera sp.]
MANGKEYSERAEEELGKIVLGLPAQERPCEICPSLRMLRQFAAGSLVSDFERDRTLNHLGVCSTCLDAVVRLRNQQRDFDVRAESAGLGQTVSLLPRSRLIRRLSIAVAACFLFAAILWISISKSNVHSVPVATIDLREIAATRGSQPDNVPIARVGADTRQIVIILPQSREDGMYEIEVKTALDSSLPLLRTTAPTIVKDHILELVIAADFSRIARGKYLLALRHANSSWEYVPVQRE